MSISSVWDPGIKSQFSWWSHTSDLKIATLAAALSGTWCYGVVAATGRPGVRILSLGEIASLICSVHLSVAARTVVEVDSSLRYTRALLGLLSNQETTPHMPSLSLSLGNILTTVRGNFHGLTTFCACSQNAWHYPSRAEWFQDDKKSNMCYVFITHDPSPLWPLTHSCFNLCEYLHTQTWTNQKSGSLLTDYLVVCVSISARPTKLRQHCNGLGLPWR